MRYSKDDVQQLIKDLGEHQGGDDGMDFEIGEPHTFGLALDVFDPVSEELITAARPARRDSGIPEILMTAEQVVAAIAAARHGRANEDRAHGREPRTDTAGNKLDANGKPIKTAKPVSVDKRGDSGPHSPAPEGNPTHSVRAPNPTLRQGGTGGPSA